MQFTLTVKSISLIKFLNYLLNVSTSSLTFEINSSIGIAPISPSSLERTPTASDSTSLSPNISIYGIF